MRTNRTLMRNERYLYRGYLRIVTLDALNGDALVHAILWDPSEPEATRPLGLTPPMEHTTAMVTILRKT
ncbi:hypothetical protein QET40_00060 [Akkermansia sp. N21169]|uniref:hypothetical protein n=1 Tax=Akkermansia sp. N21169 TaxID=3040765 RepID=UPI00244E8B60|nr:hypothetical protein [Akkermansia sp. N21169]MDH3067501.1 hypothetical protein [Akkermansia sp. N21169]